MAPSTNSNARSAGMTELTFSELTRNLIAIKPWDSFDAAILPDMQRLSALGVSILTTMLQPYGWILSNGIHDTWLRNPNPFSVHSQPELTTPAESLVMPKVFISQVLNDRIWLRKDGKMPMVFGPPPTLRFLIVVQGREGAGKQKLMVCYSSTEALHIVVHEVLNGYSVVFTGAVLVGTALPVGDGVTRALCAVTCLEEAEEKIAEGEVPVIC